MVRALTVILVIAQGLTAQIPGADQFKGRALRASGDAFPAGTELEAQFVVKSPYPMGNAYEPVRVKVGANGRFEFAVRLPRVYRHIVCLQTAQGSTRRRALAELPIVKRTPGSNLQVDVADLGNLTLRPEELLAHGPVVDDRGKPIRSLNFSLSAMPATSTPAYKTYFGIGARWVKNDGSYELHGWKVDETWQLAARYYGRHGPGSTPAKLGSETHIPISLPATGYIQTRLKLPAAFPNFGVEAIIKDVNGEGLTRRTLLKDTTNLRLLLGTYHVKLAVAGREVADLGNVEVEHAKSKELPIVDLTQDVRTLKIYVQDEQGQNIPAARITVLGTNNGMIIARERHRDTKTNQGFVHVVPMAQPSVDLRVWCFKNDYAPRVLRGVTSDQVVVLKRNR